MFVSFAIYFFKINLISEKTHLILDLDLLMTNPVDNVYFLLTKTYVFNIIVFLK